MANNLTISISANYQGNGLNTSNVLNNEIIGVTTNAAPEGVNGYSVPTTSGGTAIPLGGISAPRYLYIQNLDPTNYVSVLTGVSGTLIARMLGGATPGGDAMLIPLDPSITAPAFISHTAPCLVIFRVFGP